MKTKEPTREYLTQSVNTLRGTERGRQALRDLLAFIVNGGDNLDIVNQSACFAIMHCQFGPFAGSTRDVIRFALGDSSISASSTASHGDLATSYRWRDVGEKICKGDVGAMSDGGFLPCGASMIGRKITKAHDIKTPRT